MTQQPFLPGFKFENTQGKNYHLKQQFSVINGYEIPKLNLKNFPDLEYQPFFSAKKEFRQYGAKNDFINFDPMEHYRKLKKTKPKIFEPHFVKHDRKCLSFQGYFIQEFPEFGVKKCLFRKINMIYYLEDDTITIIEPPVPNAGYCQGRLVRRARIPKPNSNNMWHWKDLNVGIDIEIYGIVYHLSICDPFTKDYLMGQGIEVNENEEIPNNVSDKNEMNRKSNYYYCTQEIIPSRDKLYKFLQYDKKVLRFYALWNDKENEFGDEKHYKIHYYLIDDTVEVCQFSQRYSQNDQFRRLLNRTKLPKNERGSVQVLLAVSNSFSEQEYYEPKDFIVGHHIYILGRKFFVYDCDEFTRRYYKECLKIEQPSAINVCKKHPEPVVREIPPHTGIGQFEDTLQSCLSIVPKPPRKDVIHFIENTNKILRYTAKLQSDIENDKDRKFILQFSLADGKLSIYEVKTPNSGFSSGYFLKAALVPKNTTKRDKIEYYTAVDFIIGSNVDIFGRKFTITGADLAVYRYMESKPQKFSEEVMNSVRNYLQRQGILDSDSKEIKNTILMQEENLIQ